MLSKVKHLVPLCNQQLRFFIALRMTGAWSFSAVY